ncbi:hypothetical protein Tco_0966896 [Tanacetum coccineum]
MLNSNPDTGIDSILNTESTSLVEIPDLPNFGSLFGFDNRLKALEQGFSKFIQTNQYATALLSIPNIVDNYLGSKLKEAVDVASQLKSDRILEEAQAENEEFFNKVDENMMKIIKDQVNAQVKKKIDKILLRIEKLVNEQLESEVLIRSSNEAKTSHAVAANLSELELKNTLIDKMKSNKSINKSDEYKNLYKAFVDVYEADKALLDAYGDTITIKRRQYNADDDQEPSAGTDRGLLKGLNHINSLLASLLQQRCLWHTTDDFEDPTHQEFDTGLNNDQLEEEAHPHLDWFQQPSRLPSLDQDWNKTVPTDHGPVQPWLSNLARIKDPRESFDELMDTPLDFSAFMMNRPKVDTLTPELLAGITFELMKGTYKSLIELEYFFEEVYKATIEHDLRKPLPLIPNSRGCQVIPFAQFINNDLAYLSGGVSSRTYSTSIMKTKAADYGNIKWIEDLVPSSIWSEVLIIEWHGYKHLDWITIRRDDDKLYSFKDGKLTNIKVEEHLAFSVTLRMFTRSIVIQRRVEDLQLGVESYPKKLNITKPDTYRPDLRQPEAYTTYPNPQGFIYQNRDKKNRLMHLDELYKFSYDTLNDVRTALDDRLKGIQMEYLPQTIWGNSDKERASAMIQKIDKMLKSRRIMRSLERFVGERPYGRPTATAKDHMIYHMMSSS